ncbi:exodeoxyribonuclease V subunit gamma [Limnohabitans sp. B9-3]|uniref:exodeoxyribonuclease V subunit gamma n=1 Tax=Limnohabitans sp. B9-3 TaxID=1100707 RepID=UPI000C1E6F06|nr:exodeoxyribonuclease V subunit gamma [Limnohabitans sp. B9-3]PIT78599.1 exodeoxyribonuclease V subunit gamma [Limnohabitans sp. B9-3]
MSSPHATGFMVLHSNQLEGLRELAVQFIRNHPLPVLAPEVLLVQSNGMKHWLELALAKDLGICAATQVELPSAKLWQIYRAVLGPDSVPAQMPLDKSPLVWRIMRMLPVLLAKPNFAPLNNYLSQTESKENNEASPMNRRAYQLAAQLADVLDGYQNYRADWLEDWALGQDQLRTQAGYHASAFIPPLPPAQNWQPELWRDLLKDLEADAEVKAVLRPTLLATLDADKPHSFSSRAKVHEAFMAKMASLHEFSEGKAQRPAGVPHRILVFGVTSLPMQTVQALAALGRVCQVLMLVQNPCQHYWGHVVESRVPLAKLSKQRQAHKAGLPVPQDDGSLTEADQYTLHTDTHPLLAAWGKHGRDYLHLLDGFDDVDQYKGQFNRVDVFVDPAESAADHGREPHMLEHLQSSLLNLDPVPDTPAQVQDNDTSIAFVQTHSAQREVEVLHDRLLAWLDADPTLKPADIMVMVPDMANFAPHIHAVFGRFAHHAQAHDPRHLPYTVADTTPRTEPLVQALDTLLQLPQLRVTRVEWQSLFEVAAVRERFGLDEHEVAQLDTWLADAGVRWGLDAPHRKPWGMAPDMADANQNSWLFGIERLLLGYATGASGTDSQDAAHTHEMYNTWHTPWLGTLPQPGLGGLDARVVDGLLQWLRHTQMALIKLRQDHTPSEWVAVLQQLVALFFKASDEADERLIERVMAPLETWLAECQLARLDSPLPLVVVREHWMAQLQQPAMQRRFFGGGVQFATLMPMRSIPFKCVCLLGMNDGDYPRSQTPRDFDLMSDAAHAGSAQSHWRAGDRSRREDDRYLFLEALLSARDKLYISWQGRRTTDHEIKPPSVLVAQLLDYLNAVWTRGKDADNGQDLPAFDIHNQLQPLQAFSPKYFTQGTGFETYAADWQRARPADLLAQRPVHPTVQASAANSTAPAELTLQHLQRLLKQPVDVFLVDRLRLRLDKPEEAAEQEEPFSLDGLEKYKLNQSMAQADNAEQAIAQLRLTGQLALAGFGEAQQHLLLKDRNTLRDQLEALLPKWPHVLSVQSAHWQLGPNRLSAEWANGQSWWRSNTDTPNASTQWLQVALRPGAVTEGKKENQQARLDTLGHLWLHHLAACASGVPTTSVQIGFDAAVELQPIAADAAQALLQDLCNAYQEAWALPLPIAAKTACAYWLALKGDGKDPLGKAKTTFNGAHQKRGEYPDSPALQRVFNRFDEVADALPAWAERLYAPMHNAAKVIHLSDDGDTQGAHA